MNRIHGGFEDLQNRAVIQGSEWSERAIAPVVSSVGLDCEASSDPVTARKDDARAADQAASTNVVGMMLFSGGG